MKFRTEIEITSLGVKIGYENRVLALGSCFAAHIARKLAGAKFRVAENPSGILFNPLSIAAAIRSYADLDSLKRYADFAMYEVKHSTKGEVREFNMEHYRDGIYAMKQRSDFEILVRERQVDYYFQPIFSARDGHVAAYEALMRPRLPALSSPQRVMELASEMGRLRSEEHTSELQSPS